MSEMTRVPPQEQHHQPGVESEMRPPPQSERLDYVGSAKLQGKVAIITGGDSGIGKAVAIAFAKEGANVVISYLEEQGDAEDTRARIEEIGRKCVLFSGDIGNENVCRDLVDLTLTTFGRVDILVNNAAEQHTQTDFEKITTAQLEKTFRTNVFAMFHLVKAALPHLGRGARIINTTSVTAYRGSAHLCDYAATKGAIVALTRSLSAALIDRGILVNAVAPGPVWTPLIPSSSKAEQVAEFGQKAPMGRPGQPAEIAPCYVFLASEDSSYMSGQVLHPNGGEIING